MAPQTSRGGTHEVTARGIAYGWKTSANQRSSKSVALLTLKRDSAETSIAVIAINGANNRRFHVVIQPIEVPAISDVLRSYEPWSRRLHHSHLRGLQPCRQSLRSVSRCPPRVLAEALGRTLGVSIASRGRHQTRTSTRYASISWMMKLRGQFN